MGRSLRAGMPVAAALAILAFVTPGCFGRECESSYVEYGSKPGEGSFIDGDTWQSTPLDGAPLDGPGTSPRWVDFPPAQTIGMHVDAWGTAQREAILQQAFLSFDPAPNQGDSNWAPAAGNLAQFSYSRPGFIRISNNTCAHFYLRVVLKAAPEPPVVTTDGGAPGSAARDSSSE